jgi:hypothetical protein
MLHSILLYTHIAAGSLSLVAGAMAVGSRKGGFTHRAAGKAFALAMTVTALAAIAISLAIRPSPFLLSIGFFTLFLVGSGWVWGMRQNPEIRFHRSKYMAGFGLASAAYMFYTAFAGAGITVVLVAFGAVLALFAAKDLLRTVKPASPIVLHGERMGGAYIAAVTALLVVNVPEDFPLNSLWLWLGPTIIGSPLIAIGLNRWQHRSGS